jgi:hypothetical protein
MEPTTKPATDFDILEFDFNERIAKQSIRPLSTMDTVNQLAKRHLCDICGHIVNEDHWDNHQDSCIYPPKVSEPIILGRHPNRAVKLYAVAGVGRQLTKADIGKQFIHTLPNRINKFFDWSFMNGPTTLVDIAEDGSCYIQEKNTDKPHRLDPSWNNNWVEPEVYKTQLQQLLVTKEDQPAEAYPILFPEPNKRVTVEVKRYYHGIPVFGLTIKC